MVQSNLNPSEKAAEDLFDLPGSDTIPYDSGDGSLAEQESLGAAHTAESNSDESEIKNAESKSKKRRIFRWQIEENDPSEMLGMPGKLSGKTSAAKKRIVLMLAGSLGIGGLILIGLVLFMLIAGFGNKQVSESLRLANFGRLHYMSYSRTSQYLLEKSLNPDGEGFRVAKQSRSLIDRLQRFDPNKVLANLRSEGELAYVTRDGEKKAFKYFGPKVATQDLEYVVVGETKIKTPSGGWNLLENYRSQKEFAQNIRDAVEKADLFAEESRIFRTKTANAIIDSSDIKLYRWVDGGRRIRNFKDSVLSLWDRLKPSEKPSVKIDGADEAESTFEDALRNSDEAANSATELVASAETRAVEKVAKNPAKLAAGKISLVVILGTTYCMARDYVNGTQKEAEALTEQYKKGAAVAQSTVSQTEDGHVAAKAIMQQAKQNSGFNGTRVYQRWAGNPNYKNIPEDLTAADSPIPSAHESGFFYTAAKDIRDSVNTATYGVPSSARDAACTGLTSTAGAIATAITENVVGAILAAGSGGGAAVGKEAGTVAAEASLRELFTAGVSNFGKKEAIQVATRSGVDIGMFFAIDLLLKHLMGHNGNIAGNDGETAYPKQYIGTKLLANEYANTTGGRTLSKEENAQLNRVVEDHRIAMLHQKPLFTRLASLSDPHSVVSQTIASLPSDPGGLKDQALAFVGKSLNPVGTVAYNSGRLAQAATSNNNSAVYALSDDEEDLGVPTIGFSAAEIEKSLSPDFWPAANAAYVESRPGEFDDIKDCFGTMGKTAEAKCDADKLTSDHALHYRLYVYDGGEAGDGGGNSDVHDGVLGGLIDFQTVESNDTANANTPVVPKDTIDISQTGVTSNGGGIRVAKSLVSKVEALISAASADGVSLTGSGWRDPASQIELRKAHCGPSHYEIYEKPANSCKPPTARPGTSNHERGIAIDFKNCSTHATACWTWLNKNGASFGFSNLPSEPWHWSVDGR